MHEEIGPGLIEACIGAGEGLEPADQRVLVKNFLRALALRLGKIFTLMPRWTEDADSQSIHLHMSLKYKAGVPVFREPGQRNGVGQMFRWFIGGLQAYIGDMTLVFQPTVNSYRRFAPGTFAPPGLTWGYENRITCFRLFGHDAGSLPVENRLPGAETNSYLTTATTLSAGISGILGQIEPEAEVIGSGYTSPPPATSPGRCPKRSAVSARRRLRATGWATALSMVSRRPEKPNTTNSAARCRRGTATLLRPRPSRGR